MKDNIWDCQGQRSRSQYSKHKYMVYMPRTSCESRNILVL